MIEPKTFYRDFDKLLKKIRHEETRKGFVCSILEEVRNTFGDQLHINKMWLYEDRGEEFIFSLNAIRTALNYRLFSDAIKTDLEQADQIQKSLLPQMTPKFPGYE